MFPPAGSTSAQGHELQIATNCLGPYLLYRLLEPLLAKTAASSPTASVRVAWAASIAVEMLAPQPHGVVLDDAGRPTNQGVRANYGQSKVGNVFLAREGARATNRNGIVHVAFNPGNLRTELQRHWNGLDAWLTVSEGEGGDSAFFLGGCGGFLLHSTGCLGYFSLIVSHFFAQSIRS